MINSITVNKYVESLRNLKCIQTFWIFNRPIKFIDYFKDTNFNNVEIWRPYLTYRDTVGCCLHNMRAFEWKDNTVILKRESDIPSLNEEVYDENMKIIGFSYRRGNKEQLQVIVFEFYYGGGEYIPITMAEDDASK